MGYGLFNLGLIVVFGVILAMMIKNSQGTKTFFNGLGSLWGKSINGLLGKTS